MGNAATFEARLHSFEAAILENSLDLDTWLIFADFLADYDNSRAEITRLWAKKRWSDTPLDSTETRRLQTLLDNGLRPYLPRRTNSLGMEFVLVPKGTFWMSENDENAQRQVEIAHHFFIGIHPVTQGQWQNLTGNNPSSFSRTGEHQERVKGISDSDLAQFPVENVSWEDCQQFLEKLNGLDLQAEWVYRLLTEEQWEYACRGGATSKEECSYHFYLATPTNDLLPSQANFYRVYPSKDGLEPNLERPTTVGSFQPNVLGLYDMHGNVWEWCQDWYSNADEELEEGICRLFRGGSCLALDRECRAAMRDGVPPSVQNELGGLRLVLVQSKK